MDVSTYIRPNTKNFIEGYDLLRTFLSETKSRFASDSIEDIITVPLKWTDRSLN